jgi:T-complex protein 1 subunit gamma
MCIHVLVNVHVCAALAQRAKTIEGVEQWPFRAVGNALEVIPRTLAQNCGADTVRLLTELRVRTATAIPFTFVHIFPVYK